MQDELKTIQREVGTTFIHVTHDQEEAMAIADRVVLMNAGRIEDQGSPERVYLRPQTAFSAAFMGEINTIPGTAEDGGVATPLGHITVAHHLAVGQKAMLCVRPEHLLRQRPAIGQATVQDGAFFGTHTRVHLSVEGLPDLIAHLPVGAEIKPGDAVPLTPDTDAMFVLPRDPQ
ncbi:MAG: TOBE domain-containing protein [Pseudomonadota bacterium]